jgi:hypothetical protein
MKVRFIPPTTYQRPPAEVVLPLYGGHARAIVSSDSSTHLDLPEGRFLILTKGQGALPSEVIGVILRATS